MDMLDLSDVDYAFILYVFARTDLKMKCESWCQAEKIAFFQWFYYELMQYL